MTTTLYPHLQTDTAITQRSSVPIRLRPPWAKVISILALAQLANSSSPTKMQSGLALSLTKVTEKKAERERCKQEAKEGRARRKPSATSGEGPSKSGNRVNSETVRQLPNARKCYRSGDVGTNEGAGTGIQRETKKSLFGFLRRSSKDEKESVVR